MNHAARNHQWLFSLSAKELEDVANRISGIRMTTTPAEKRIATILLKQMKEGVKPPSAAQQRARLLGQCKFFLTGADGTLSNLMSMIERSPLTDIPPLSLKEILRNVRLAKRAIQVATKEVATQNKILTLATAAYVRPSRKKETL